MRQDMGRRDLGLCTRAGRPSVLSRFFRNETDAMRPRWCNPIVGDSSAGDLPSGPVELIGGVEKRDNGVESGDNKVIPRAMINTCG